MEMRSNTDIENLSITEKKEYYNLLRKECLLLKKQQHSFGQNFIYKYYPLLRKYKLEIQGKENIPKDSNVLFMVNHSNSHDIFTAYEFFSLLDRKGSVMVATDCLNLFSREVFNVSYATMFDRRNKEEKQNSIIELSSKVLDGYDGLIFGESTWNLHPVIPMHNIKYGISKISAITQVPIIPTIFEYLENDGIIKSEQKLYSKCIIRFGKPIYINLDDSLINQTDKIKNRMVNLRTNLWTDYGINKSDINSIDPDVYVNHTYLKKFDAIGFTYDSPSEFQHLLFLNDEPKENEYFLDENGIFRAGTIEKKVRRK